MVNKIPSGLNETPSTSKLMRLLLSSMRENFLTHISLVVSVPVLSLHITVVQPSVCTLGNFRTIAFSLAILLVPKAKHVVITAGKPKKSPKNDKN